MTDIFNVTVIFTPRPIINNGLSDNIDTTNNCVGYNDKYCPIVPSVLPVGHNSSTPLSILERNVADVCMYISFPKNFNSIWFWYLGKIFDECMTPDDPTDLVKPITDECIENLYSTSSFFHPDYHNVDMNKYRSCVED